MNEKRKRVVKTIYAFSVVLLALFVSVSSSFFVSKADTYQKFYVNYAEPTCSANQGYVNLLLYNIAEDYYAIRTFFWYTAATNSNTDLPIYAIVSTTKTSFTFNIGGNIPSGASVYYSLTQIGETGNYWNIKNSSSASYTVDLASQGWECRGMKYKGNVGQASQGAGYSLFEVSFAGDSDALILQSLYEVLSFHSGQNAEMIDKLTTIMNSSLSMKQKIEEIYKLDVKIEGHLVDIKTYLAENFPDILDKLDKMIEEQGYTNNWLEEIYDIISEILGLEGEEEPETLPDDEIDSVLEGESNLMQDTTSAENNLNLTIDANSNNVVWNVIERVLNSNARVFGAFIGIMTLGVVTLLLNR